MTAFKIAWDPARSYRCFVDESAGVANLVGSRIIDDAIGHRVGTVTIVVDEEGTVCDVEFQLTRGGAAGARVAVPEAAGIERVDTIITTMVGGDADPIVLLDGEWLIASFVEQRRVAWRRLAGSAVYLGLDNGELLVLAVRNPEADTDGSAESAWLDAIQGTSGTRQRRAAPVEA